MSLFKYYKRKDVPPKSLLPEPTLLSKTIPSHIEVVNSEVEPLVEKARIAGIKTSSFAA